MRNEQGVVISLILFIVLTLVFGVATYMGAKNYKERAAALSESKSKVATALTDKQKAVENLKNLVDRLGYGSRPAGDIVEAIDVDIKGALGDAAGDVTVKDAVAKLKGLIEQKDSAIAARIDSRDGNYDDANGQIKTAEGAKTDFEDNAKSNTDTLLSALARKSEEYADLTGQFNEQTLEFDKVRRDARKAVEVSRKEAEKEKNAADNFAEINIDLSRRIDLLTNADFDQADARVVATDQAGRFVRLDVGKLDGARPLTKFNVFSKDALVKGGVKAKASVQVTRSLDDHLCEARILSDSNTDPIEPGDVVFTPLWRPGDVYRYALDYRLDINGDGISDFDEVYRAIQISGGEVAAYIDDDGSVRGKITPDVFRIIVSDEPIEERIESADRMTEEAKAKLLEDQKAFLESAESNGVPRMFLTDLLVQLGYKKTNDLERYKDETLAAKELERASRPDVESAGIVPAFNSSKGAPGGALPLFEEGADATSKDSGATDVGFRRRVPRG
ncbi:MAG: hypothetical protein IJM30_11185 [Thermoguttaceae bacterium]|nr:hypothetical protein [Thermoguttaceae bacterium]